MEERKNLALLSFISDLSLSLWSYFSLTNYEEYLKTISPMVSSPDFQIQIYQVLLQTLTFSLSLFMVFHLVIYILYWKEKSYATKYVYYYSFMAALSCLLMLVGQIYLAIIPLILYSFIFVKTKKMIKKAEL
ncbi:MAG: hypothetical protein KBD76_09955 [Bacteriovorax sp.]|nr:hypothetical protein [Bacteriovorax sp.]